MGDSQHASPALALIGPEARTQESFGGLVPSGAIARDGETVVVALVVEHHADGVAVPLLAMSGAPGILGIDPAKAIGATDDLGRVYEVSAVSGDAGLGAVQTTIWVAPALPADARRLSIEVTELTRTSANRRGAASRPLADGPWVLDIDLVPERTAVAPPPRPRSAVAPVPSSTAPARSAASLESVVPVGQARVATGLAVCLWAIERYSDRAVLSLGTLAGEDLGSEPISPGQGTVSVWDDVGTVYGVSPIHGAAGSHWTESSLELTPVPPAGATALGIRVSDLPGGARTPEAQRALERPYEFGVALPASSP